MTPRFDPFLRDGLLGFPVFVVASKRRSKPSRAIFANRGEAIPPCGVPAPLSRQSPSSTDPALSQPSIVLLKVGNFASNGPWAMLWKQPLMSASRIHWLDLLLPRAMKIASIASIVHRPGRNP